MARVVGELEGAPHEGLFVDTTGLPALLRSVRGDPLAGLGALGEGGHTPNESLDLAFMPVAIKRAAMLIYRLSNAE